MWSQFHTAEFAYVAAAILLAAGATLPACKVEAESTVAMDAESIGIATMKPDGTIVLDLRKPALAILTYPLSHPQYDEVIRHLRCLEAR